MSKTLKTDIDTLVELVPTAKLIDLLPKFTDATHASVTEKLLSQKGYALRIVKELGHRVLDAVNNPKSPFNSIIDSQVLEKYAEKYLSYLPEMTVDGFRFLPIKDYVERVIKTADALSTFNSTPPESIVLSVNRVINGYTKFIGEEYDVEGKYSIWKDDPGYENHFLEDINKEKKKKEHRDDFGWRKFTDEICAYVDAISDNEFLSKDVTIIESARKLLKLFKGHKKDPISEACIAKVSKILDKDIFVNAEELKTKKDRFIKLAKKHTENVENLTVNKFVEIFNKAAAFAEEFEDNLEPLKSSNIGKVFEDFSDKALSKFAQEFVVSSATPENNKEFTKLCETLRANQTLANSFVQKYTVQEGADIKVIAQMAQIMTP